MSREERKQDKENLANAQREIIAREKAVERERARQKAEDEKRMLDEKADLWEKEFEYVREECKSEIEKIIEKKIRNVEAMRKRGMFGREADYGQNEKMMTRVECIEMLTAVVEDYREKHQRKLTRTPSRSFIEKIVQLGITPKDVLERRDVTKELDEKDQQLRSDHLRHFQPAPKRRRRGCECRTLCKHGSCHCKGACSHLCRCSGNCVSLSVISV
jgi:hypothetical protein